MNLVFFKAILMKYDTIQASENVYKVNEKCPL